MCIAAAEDSWREVSLKCTNVKEACRSCTEKCENKRGIMKTDRGRNRNINSADTITTPGGLSCCHSSNERNNIHIPVGSHIIPLHYQPDAWISLRSLKVNGH